MRQASADIGRWRELGLDAPRVAVNVSPIQLRQENFVDEVRAIAGAGDSGLDLEITESVLMENLDGNIAKLREVSAMGVKIAIDDFGTGYSSLAYLAKLPVTAIKIDRAFVNDMASGPESLAIISSIIALGHALERSVVAEGVETEEQANLLKLLRCDEWQGYLYSKPVPFEALTALLRQSIPIEETACK